MPADSALPPRPGPRRAAGGRDAVIACALLAAVSAIVAGVSWTRPDTAPATVSYTQSGRVAYSARTDPGSVYGGGQVATGQPVYGSAVSALHVTYTYRLTTPARVDVTGSEQLVAMIGNGQGLSRAIALQAAPRTFSGEGFTAGGTLNLADLRTAAAAFSSAAGGSGGGSFPVTISASVTAHGRIAGQAWSGTFSPPVDFTYAAGNLLPGGPSGGGGPAGFSVASSGSVSVPGGRSAAILWGISVASARITSLAVLVGALLLGGLLGWPLLRQATSPDESERIMARHGSLIVESDGVQLHPGATVVHMASFGDLLQVSRRLECPILHCDDGGDVYWVVDSGTLYRYRAPSAGATLWRLPSDRRTPAPDPGLFASPRPRSAATGIAAVRRGDDSPDGGRG